ncbi:MAG: hypothetical protein IPL65_01930 [Lewinellaceae bacterium]|nr:hypothetical protein [Lewinellaceae bacterium]
MQPSNRLIFHAFIPSRGIVLFAVLVAIGMGLLFAMDCAPWPWLHWAVVRFLVMIVLLALAYFALGRVAITRIDAWVDEQGIWISHVPGWILNREQETFIQWSKVDHWVLRKGELWNMHAISWDRFRISLTDGRVIRLYPVNDFDSKDDFTVFIQMMYIYTEHFNRKTMPSQPILAGSTLEKKHSRYLLEILGFVVMAIFVLFAVWITLQKPSPNWPMIVLQLFFAALLIFVAVLRAREMVRKTKA